MKKGLSRLPMTSVLHDLGKRRNSLCARTSSGQRECTRAKLSGRKTELLVKLSNEMGAVAKPSAQRNLRNCFLRILQKPFCVAQTGMAQVCGRRLAEFRLKQSCELPPADTDLFCNPLRRHCPEQALLN